MALSNATFTDIGGSVSDLFAGLGASEKGALQAQGLDITAEGTDISAESTKITAEGLRTKAAGDIAESNNYDIAANLAGANEAFTEQSTRIQQAQLARSTTQAIGTEEAGVAGAGFSSGGSAGDLLRSSMSQGALARGVMAQQGVITEAGFTEQQQSFETMAATGRATAASELDIAGQTDTIAGQQTDIANQQRQLAVATQTAADNQATGDFVSSAVKGVAAVATLFLK